jgi:hypothetical protein
MRDDLVRQLMAAAIETLAGVFLLARSQRDPAISRIKNETFSMVSNILRKSPFLLDRPVFRANFGVPLRGATALQRAYQKSAGNERHWRLDRAIDRAQIDASLQRIFRRSIFEN